MRFANVAYDGKEFAARVEADGLRRLRGLGPIGPGTDFERLANAEGHGDALDPDLVRLLPPVVSPRRVICLGLNYRGHVQETKRELPTYPVLFTKWSDSLIGPRDAIVRPPESEQVDYEAELAVVIGRPMRRVNPENALGHVAGYTAANDVTMRDYQYKSHQWLQGKAWPRSTPLGPYLVTGDEIGDGAALDIRLLLNTEEMQHSNTENMIFGVAVTLSTLSEFVAFEAGDVVLLGTPGGVGFRRDPQVFLHQGDEVVVEIEGIGTLRNVVADEQPLR
ncbi:MAG: fumarylacetoacetate hydrolase family protein [Actinomycetota bacterium]|nr:fumarylacetoacetate hydrolase family protein [Actinomycetota bacterium]